MDKIVSFSLTDYPVRLYIAFSTDTVGKMHKLHGTTPNAAAMAGRTITATALMGSMLKNDTDVLTVTINCSGEIQRVVATAGNSGKVKCDILNPQTNVYHKAPGKLDVAAVVGEGTLTVVKDLGMKNPYVGQVDLVSGEIAQDFTYYFAVSEQTPSAVSLGVYVGKDLNIISAGGFILQLMPGCEEEVIDILEGNIAKVPTISEMLTSGYDEYKIADTVFGDLKYHMLSEMPLEYYCDCNEEKIEKMLIALGKDELNDIISEGKDTEIVCHFCNTKYTVTTDRMKEILEAAL
ncbi:MAG: Hsp33 family molecular chaperone HslO [Anaerofustis stercorihominis]|nr:Hsp33 family molecular chaperone HslO [Anaerofustis stercorihominis]